MNNTSITLLLIVWLTFFKINLMYATISRFFTIVFTFLCFDIIWTRWMHGTYPLYLKDHPFLINYAWAKTIPKFDIFLEIFRMLILTRTTSSLAKMASTSEQDTTAGQTCSGADLIWSITWSNPLAELLFFLAVFDLSGECRCVVYDDPSKSGKYNKY
jgi:hypothetical protein